VSESALNRPQLLHSGPRLPTSCKQPTVSTESSGPVPQRASPTSTAKGVNLAWSARR
jgi:hypothetical protein